MTIAALTKTMDIRLWDVSAGGCLLEFGHYVPVGTVGVLAVELDGRRHLEWFRICRVHGDEGRRSRCLVGAEFLMLSPPRRDSLRVAIARKRGRAASEGIPKLAGRSSGDPGKSTRRRRARRAPAAPESKVSVQIGGNSAASSSTHELAAWLLDSPPRACPKPEKE